MAELVPPLARGIFGQGDQPLTDTPFAFYGHSLGGRIAFEVARWLRRQGLPQPCHLFVGANQAPHLPWPHSHLHALEEGAFLAEIQQRYRGVPRQVLEDPELRALLIPTLRADVRVLETCAYTAEPPLDCPIIVFGGAADQTVSHSALDAWRDQTSAGFRLHLIAGGHFFMQTSREVPRIIRGELASSAVIAGQARQAGTYVDASGV